MPKKIPKQMPKHASGYHIASGISILGILFLIPIFHLQLPSPFFLQQSIQQTLRVTTNPVEETVMATEAVMATETVMATEAVMATETAFAVETDITVETAMAVEADMAIEPITFARESTTKRITLYQNGESTMGVHLDITLEHFKNVSTDFATLASKWMNEHLIKLNSTTNMIQADRIFNGKGKIVSTFDDLVDGEFLYLVPPGFHFVWPFVKFGHKVYLSLEDSPYGEPIVIESLMESPRVFRLHNFISDEESGNIIETALTSKDGENQLRRSSVGDFEPKKTSSLRTSENSFDQTSETAKAIKRRAFHVLALPEYNGAMADGLQVVRYKEKEAYIPHHDYVPKDVKRKNYNFLPATGGSNRFATVFAYLTDVESGGQTVFPQVDMPTGLPQVDQHPLEAEQILNDSKNLFSNDSWEFKMLNQCYRKFSIYPRRNSAILFYSQTPEGELDPLSLHGGCPVLNGTKWAANLWVWNKPMFGANRKLKVWFNNPIGQPLELYWGDKFMQHIPPKGKIYYDTFETHPWTIRYLGKVVHSFIGNSDSENGIHVTPPLTNILDVLHHLTSEEFQQKQNGEMQLPEEEIILAPRNDKNSLQQVKKEEL